MYTPSSIFKFYWKSLVYKLLRLVEPIFSRTQKINTSTDSPSHYKAHIFPNLLTFFTINKKNISNLCKWRAQRVLHFLLEIAYAHCRKIHIRHVLRIVLQVLQCWPLTYWFYYVNRRNHVKKCETNYINILGGLESVRIHFTYQC